MTELIIPSEAPALNKLKERKQDHLARKAVFSLLSNVKHGRIAINEDNRRHVFGEAAGSLPLQFWHSEV